MGRPATLVAIGVIVGLLAAGGGLIGAALAVFAVAALVVAALLAAGRPTAGWALRQGTWALALGLLVGALRAAAGWGDLPQTHVGRVATTDPTRWTLVGRVVEGPTTRRVVWPPLTWTVLRLEVEEIADGEAGASSPCSGAVDVFLRPLEREVPEVAPGDRLRVEGDLSLPPAARNPGQLDLRRKRAVDGVYATLSVRRWDRCEVVGPGGRSVGRALAAARRRLDALLEGGLDTRSAPLAKALVLGDTSGLDGALLDAFERSGTYHLLAVSGLHTAALAAGLLAALRAARVPRRSAAALVILSTWAFCGLVGMEPSVVRASLMVSAYLIAPVLRREPDGLSALGLAAVAILLGSPAELTEAGFQLSFVAVLALVTVASPVSRAWRARVGASADPSSRDGADRRAAEGGPGAHLLAESWGVGVRAWALAAAGARSATAAIGDLAIVSTVAWVATAPIVLYHFHVVTPVAVLANIPAAALFAVALGAAVVFLGLAALVPIAVAAPAASACELSLRLLAGWVEVSAGLVEAAFLPSIHPVQALAALALLATAGWLLAGTMRRGRAPEEAAEGGTGGGMAGACRHRARPVAAAAVAMGLAACALVPPGPAPIGEGEARLTILDVSHGSAALVETAAGAALFDCGSSRLWPGRRVIAPALWDSGHRSIRHVFLSHPDADHTNGLLDVLDRFAIGSVYVAAGFAEVPRGRELLAGLARRGVPFVQLRAGEHVDLGGAVRAEVLAAPELPTGSVPFAGSVRGGGRRASSASASNDGSLVVRVVAGGRSALFPGDIEEAGARGLLAALAEGVATQRPERFVSGDDQGAGAGHGGASLEASRGPPVDVVVIPHHGAANREAARLAQALRPRLALSSSRRGFADRRTLAAFTAAGAHVAETWRSGAVQVRLGAGALAWEGFAWRGEPGGPP